MLRFQSNRKNCRGQRRMRKRAGRLSRSIVNADGQECRDAVRRLAKYEPSVTLQHTQFAALQSGSSTDTSRSLTRWKRAMQRHMMQHCAGDVGEDTGLVRQRLMWTGEQLPACSHSHVTMSTIKFTNTQIHKYINTQIHKYKIRGQLP